MEAQSDVMYLSIDDVKRKSEETKKLQVRFSICSISFLNPAFVLHRTLYLINMYYVCMKIEYLYIYICRYYIIWMLLYQVWKRFLFSGYIILYILTSSRCGYKTQPRRMQDLVTPFLLILK